MGTAKSFWLPIAAFIIVGTVVDVFLANYLYGTEIADVALYIAVSWVLIAAIIAGIAGLSRGRLNPTFSIVASTLLAVASIPLSESVFYNMGQVDFAYFVSYFTSSWDFLKVFDWIFVAFFSVYFTMFRPSARPGVAAATSTLGLDSLTLGSAPNEPLRLVLSSIMLGRVSWISGALDELSTPYSAKPFNLGIDESLARQAHRRYEEWAFKYHVYFALIALAGLALWGMTANFLLAIVPALIAASVVYSTKSHGEKYKIAPQFSPARFASLSQGGAGSSAEDADAAEQREASEANVVIYKGFTPFENFGLQFGDWVLTADITRRQRAAVGADDTDPEIVSLPAAKARIARSVGTMNSTHPVLIREIAGSGRQHSQATEIVLIDRPDAEARH